MRNDSNFNFHTVQVGQIQIPRPPVLVGQHQQRSEGGLKQGSDYFVPVNQHKKSFRGEKM